MGTLEGKHALIFLAGPETEYRYIEEFMQKHPQSYVVCADGGLRHAHHLGCVPDLLIGDFDSGCVGPAGEVIRLRPEKDDTDSQTCLREVLRRGCKKMTLVCATGGRLDHLLANLSLLEEAAAFGAHCAILDRQNYVVLYEGGMQTFLQDMRYPYFSIVPLDAVLHGVTITGAKYPLKQATVTRAGMLTISNEAIRSEFTVEIAQGSALILFTRDAKDFEMEKRK